MYIYKYITMHTYKYIYIHICINIHLYISIYIYIPIFSSEKKYQKRTSSSWPSPDEDECRRSCLETVSCVT